MNFRVTDQAATYLFSSGQRKEKIGTSKWMLDVVAAPAYNKQALTILTQRKNTKVFANQGLYLPDLRVAESAYRFTRESMVRQTRPDYILNCPSLDWTLPLKNKKK